MKKAARMGQPLSMDLRLRLLAAVDGGMSCRAVAARFGVAPSTAIRWHAQRRDIGDCAAKPEGDDMRSRRVEERALYQVSLIRTHEPASI